MPTQKKRRKKPNKKSSSKRKSGSKRKATKKPATDRTCFTIMPFGSWFDDYYESIYVPAIESAGLTARRADDLYRPSAIVNDIWTMTKEAAIILADLSGKNPNVFYELGLAHALTKPAILVTEAMEDVPFDLRSLRVIVYEKNEPTWGDILGEKIETAIREILSSPMDSVLPTFLRVKESLTKKTVSKEKKELISLRQDMDLIRRQIESIGPGSTRPTRQGSISYRDAIELAKSYITVGIDEQTSINLLLDEGVPSRGSARMVYRNALSELKPQKRSTKRSTRKQSVKRAG